METIRTKSSLRSWLATVLAALPLLIGCSNPVEHIPELKPEQLAGRPIQQQPYEQTYKMVPYDLIAIRFPFHPEQDPKAAISIRPDGQISLDGVGTLRAAGLTPDELSKEIVAKTSTRLRNPEVVVTVTQFAPRRIFVGGQVRTPGIVQFQGEITPIQAIFERGGFTTEAQMDSVVLIRNAGGQTLLSGASTSMTDWKVDRRKRSILSPMTFCMFRCRASAEPICGSSSI